MTSLLRLLINISVKSSVLFSVLYLLRLLLKRRINPLVMSRLWLLVFILVCLPIEVTSPVSWEQVLEEGVRREIKSMPERISQTYDLPVLETRTQRFNIPVLVYSLGLLLFASRYLYQTIKLRLESKVLVIDISDQLQRLAIKKPIKVYTSRLLTSPAVMGIRPRIFFPQGLYRSLSEKDLHHVLLHELSHIKAYDHLYNCLLLVYKSVFWFNPLSHFFFRIIKEDMEFACDSRVKRVLGDKEWSSYGHTLLNLASKITSKKQAIVAPLAEDKHVLRERIEQLISTKKHSKILLLMMVIIMALTGCVIMTKAEKVAINEPVIETPIEPTRDEVSENLDKSVAEEILNTNDVDRFKAFESYIKTDYIDPDGQVIGSVTVNVIESQEESSALYLKESPDEVVMSIDEFNGVISNGTYESAYVVQYTGKQKELDLDKMSKADVDYIYDLLETYKVGLDLIKITEMNSLKEVYLFTNDSQSLLFLVEDSKISGRRLLSYPMKTIEFATVFWPAFYDEAVKDFDYDYFVKDVLPYARGYFEISEVSMKDIFPVDMTNHYYVHVSDQVIIKVNKESKDMFFIQNLRQGQVQEPLNEEDSLKAVNDFIKESPMQTWNMTLENVSFEYKFDSRQKEYYVFEYKKHDGPVYIKFNTFTRQVHSLWY